jgi:hypothetical protein
LTTIVIGRTTYDVDQSTTAADTYFLTGPRGATLMAIPFSNNPDLYHAFRLTGSHADLKVSGQLAKFPKTDLDAAVAGAVAA